MLGATLVWILREVKTETARSGRGVLGISLGKLSSVQLSANHGLWSVSLLVPGISQARVLERAAVPSSGRSSPPRNQTWISCVSCIWDKSTVCESRSVVSDSLWPHELSNPWNPLVQNTGVGSLSFLQGNLPSPGIKLRSPALQADSSPAEPQGKPKNTGVGSLSVLQQIFLTQESNQGLLHCRWILYQLSYQSSPSCTAGGLFTCWAIWRGDEQRSPAPPGDSLPSAITGR